MWALTLPPLCALVSAAVGDVVVISIRHWQSAMEFDLPVGLDSGFSQFKAMVQAEVPAVPPLSRFYHFPSADHLNARTEVRDDSTLNAYMMLAALPPFTHKLYISPGPGSPGEFPTPSFAALPRAEVEALARGYFSARLASRGASATPSVHSETSSNRRAIRQAVISRDMTCVVCGSTQLLDAAHIISHKASVGFVQSCGISTTETASNGVMLCFSCHKLFDSFFWCVRRGTVVVSEALKRHPELGVVWRERSGALLRLNSQFKREWPAPSAWAAHQRAFCMMEGEDPLSRAPPVVCHSCSVVLVNDRALRRHRCSPVRRLEVPEEAGEEE